MSIPINKALLDAENGPLQDGLAMAKVAAMFGDAGAWAKTVGALIQLGKLELQVNGADAESDAGSDDGAETPEPGRILSLAERLRASRTA